MAASQNTDLTSALADLSVLTLGESAAVALSNLYLATSKALADGARFSTQANASSTSILQATTAMGVAVIYGLQPDPRNLPKPDSPDCSCDSPSPH